MLLSECMGDETKLYNYTIKKYKSSKTVEESEKYVRAIQYLGKYSSLRLMKEARQKFLTKYKNNTELMNGIYSRGYIDAFEFFINDFDNMMNFYMKDIETTLLRSLEIENK